MADIFIRLLADGLLIPIVLIGAWVMIRLPREGRDRLYVRAFMTGITALIIAKISGFFYHAERPFVVMGAAAKASFLQNGGFPSDHALLAFTITLVVWATTKNVTVSLALLVMSVLLSIGRVLALVHTPVDVLGGAAFAFIAAMLWYGPSLLSVKLRRPASLKNNS